MTNRYGLDLRRAWSKVLRDVPRDDVPDLLRWQDYTVVWDEWEAELECELDAGTYRPRAPALIEVPKDELTVRPIAVLHPRDRVVYEAIIEQLTPAIESVLPDLVYSARVKHMRPARTILRNQVRDWVRFQNAGRKLYEEFHSAYALTTDITSYFEYVDIKVLVADLHRLQGVDHRHVDLLADILIQFEQLSEVWGLPQGPEGSAILGNFYLLPVDRELMRHPVKHIRYQDDMYIFADSPAKLRLALRDVNRLLRQRRLNIAVRKTQVLKGKAILDSLEDERKGAIQYGLDIGDVDALGDLCALFDEAVAVKPYKVRDIRFAVVRLRRLRNPHAIPWILDHLAEIPYLAVHLTRYLNHYADSYPEIELRVREYLLDPSANLYPFSEAHLIRLLAQLPAIADETHSYMWTTARDSNKESYVHEYAIWCIGKHARPGDVDALRNLFLRLADTARRRAVLVALHLAGGLYSDWADRVAATERNLEPTCRYLSQAKKLAESRA